jgi:hypothetical protein
MKPLWKRALLSLCLGGIALPVWADDPPGKEPPAKQEDKLSPAERFTAAKKAQTEASAAFDKLVAQYRKDKKPLNTKDKDFNEVYQARTKTNQALIMAANELLKSDAKSDLGFEAITTVISLSQPTPAIMKALAEHHTMHPKIGTLLSRLAFAPPSQDTKDFLRAVIEKNPSRDAKGNATFTLANILQRSNRNPNKNKDQVAADNAEAEKLFEKVLADYKDIKVGQMSLAERSESNLFEIRHLQIGNVVPDIEGEDTDGKKFKLSDYRGKVVMLDFWGHW